MYNILLNNWKWWKTQFPYQYYSSSYRFLASKDEYGVGDGDGDGGMWSLI